MGDFLPPMRCPTEEDEYLFKLNKFHLTMPMARYGNRPIRVGVNIQKKVFRLSQVGTPSKIAP